MKQRYSQRLETGWDPIAAEYAEQYSALCAPEDVESEVANVVRQCGLGPGKSVLDLGAGPGQYSIAFAEKGCLVTWRDPSRVYLKIAQRQSSEANVHVEYSIGHIDNSLGLSENSFDVVFNRVCWYYSSNDLAFARHIFSLIKPGGYGYIVANNDSFYRHKKRSFKNLLAGIFYNNLGIKLTYLHPERGVLARLFLEQPCSKIFIDYSNPNTDVIVFQKSVS